MAPVIHGISTLVVYYIHMVYIYFLIYAARAPAIKFIITGIYHIIYIINSELII